MDQVGPISRTVSDCAITLGAIAGHDPKDGHTWDVPVPDYLAEMSGGVQGLKIGVITERVEGNAVDPQVRDLVVKAIAQLGAVTHPPTWQVIVLRLRADGLAHRQVEVPGYEVSHAAGLLPQVQA